MFVCRLKFSCSLELVLNFEKLLSTPCLKRRPASFFWSQTVQSLTKFIGKLSRTTRREVVAFLLITIAVLVWCRWNSVLVVFILSIKFVPLMFMWKFSNVLSWNKEHLEHIRFFVDPSHWTIVFPRKCKINMYGVAVILHDLAPTI